MWSIIGILWVFIAWRRMRRLRQRHPVNPVQVGLAAAAVIVGAVGLTALWCGWFEAKHMDDQGRRRLDQAQGYMVARAIRHSGSDGAVVILCASDEITSARIQAIQSGLAAALNGPIRTVGVAPADTVRAKASDEDTPVSARLQARDFDRALAELDAADIVVIATEPPRDLRRMRLWRKQRTAPVYWLEVNLPELFHGVISSGALAGVSALNLQSDFERVSIPANPEQAFLSRYRWISAADLNS